MKLVYYKRIIKLREKCSRLFDETKNDEYLYKMYSIDTFFECETYKIYESIAHFCKENNFCRIFDIGCAYGLQSEIFRNKNIDYIGVNENKRDIYIIRR